MKTQRFARCSWLIALCAIWVAPATAAEIYKWVDAQGRTHYSERKDGAGAAKTGQLKVAASPAPAKPSREDSLVWPARPRHVPPPVEAPVAPPKPSPAARTREPETNSAKCELARAVLSGAVRHGNGAPTDAYDRQVAESDVRAFCGK